MRELQYGKRERPQTLGAGSLRFMGFAVMKRRIERSVSYRQRRELVVIFSPGGAAVTVGGRGSGRRRGFTLAEILLGGVVLAVAAAAILGAYVGQVTLNEHARNLSLAVHDANRVIERMRQDNSGAGCTNLVKVIPPANGTWDAWLGDTTPSGGGGKSVGLTPAAALTNERIFVTCQDRDGGALATDYCGVNQGGDFFTPPQAASTQMDPIRVTVAVCWRHRNRTIGECSFNPATSVWSTANGTNGPNKDSSVIESPAMLTTLITCRG